MEVHLHIGDKSFDGIAKVPVQFVIGDCKGNNALCGPYGSHGEKVKHLVCDCDILTKDADDPDHMCSFFTQEQVMSWVKDQLTTLRYRCRYLQIAC